MKVLKRLTAVVLAFVVGVLSFVLDEGIPVQAANNSNVYGGVDYSAVFDSEYYYNNYPDLQAAFGYNHKALLKHFVECGMAEGRVAKGTFKIDVYKERYADLVRAFGNDNKQYYLHFMNCGEKEGRIAGIENYYKGVDYSLVYDVDYYYENYPDLQKAFGYDPAALIAHFVECGMKEGRTASLDFNFDVYKDKYPDLVKAFKNDNKQYYIHYMYTGIKEKRRACLSTVYNGVDYAAIYDANYYFQNYPDIQKAIGFDTDELIKHFVEFGMKEQRVASNDFNIKYYMTKYWDLKAAFGDDVMSYYNHYMTYGIKEKRLGNEWSGWKTIDGRKYFYNDNGELKSLTGVDVSSHNKEIDWEKVKNDDIDFAIIRVGYGGDYADQDDKYAAYNMDECERLGIPYGVYLYSYALTDEDVESEIAHTLRLIQGRNPVIGVYYDMEDADSYKNNHGMPSNEQLGNFCVRFAQAMRDNGYKSGVYASRNWFTYRLTNPLLNNYERWVAHWNTDKCTYQGTYSMWQYTSDGSVDGINGRADMNVLIVK